MTGKGKRNLSTNSKDREVFPLASQKEEVKSLGLSALCLLSHPVYCHEASEKGKPLRVQDINYLIEQMCILSTYYSIIILLAKFRIYFLGVY